WTRFDTIAGEWQTVTIKIDEMERHFFGQKLPGTITPDQVRGIDFYIYDKKAGPFRLEIDNIQAVSTDGRNLAQAETSN
ncbi:MAG: CIA30 family protein, partial [Planctomycetota bacterium]